jgi:hypothetical protein
VRAKAQRTREQAVADIAKGGPLSGISRTYLPRADDGDRLPAESTRVQLTVEGVTDRLAADLGRLWDVTATKDWANTEANADVVVDGQVLLAQVPSSFLVWFEKQLAELRGYVSRLPVLDPAEVWHYDDASAAWRSEPVQTIRTTKVPKNHVVAPATKEHAAQVQVYTVDVPEGDWTTTKFSGAVPEARRKALLDRVDALAEAVKFAREEANQHTVTDRSVGDVVFGYLLA